MDFSFNLTNGDKAVIIGEEGNGKSTLLKLIYDRKLVESYCEWDGKIISKSKLAYLPQMIDESISDMTLSEYFENTEYYLYTDRADRYLYAGGEMAAVIPSRLYLLPETVYDIIHKAIFTFQLHGAVRTVVHREDTAAVLAYAIALRPWAEGAL